MTDSCYHYFVVYHRLSLSLFCIAQTLFLPLFCISHTLLTLILNITDSFNHHFVYHRLFLLLVCIAQTLFTLFSSITDSCLVQNRLYSYSPLKLGIFLMNCKSTSDGRSTGTVQQRKTFNISTESCCCPL